MNLDALVAAGATPWAPADATDLDTWHGYDQPLTGTFTKSGQTCLFLQVLENSGISFWAYVPLDDETLARFEETDFDSTRTMLAAIDELFAGREAVLAVARDLRIVQWTRRTVTDGLLDATMHLLDQAVESMRKEQPERAERTLRAGIYAVAGELADDHTPPGDRSGDLALA